MLGTPIICMLMCTARRGVSTRHENTSVHDRAILSVSPSNQFHAYLQDGPHGGEQQALLGPRRRRLPQHHVQQRVVADVRAQAHPARPVARQQRRQRGQHLR